MGNHNIKSIIKEGTVENVKEYLSHEPDMKNHVFRYGWTPTHLAVEYHKLDILKYLMEDAGADIRHVDNALSNLLHHALHFADEHFDIVKYLLDSGHFKFDNTKDEHENTALHLAFKYCSLKQIAELNPYYKGLKELFQEKNDHQLTPLALLKERCKNQPESLEIVERLREEIEKEPSDDEKKGGSKHGSSDEGGGSGLKGSRSKMSSSGNKHGGSKHGSSEEGKGGGSKVKNTKKHSDEDKKDHEEKEETKKHSDDDKKEGGSEELNGSGKKHGSKKKKNKDKKKDKEAHKAD